MLVSVVFIQYTWNKSSTECPEQIISKTVCCISVLDSLPVSQPKLLYGEDNRHMLPAGLP